MAIENQDSVSLLDFPAEIRNLIYEHALVDNHDSDDDDDDDDYYSDDEDTDDDDNDNHNNLKIANFPPYIREPALLMVSKQVRKESMPVFYGKNEFRTTDSESLKGFMEQFGRERLSLLRSVICISPMEAIMFIGDSTSFELRREFYRDSQGMPWDQFLHFHMMRKTYLFGEAAVRIGEQHGMPRTAFLLPIYGDDEGIEWRGPRSVSVDEYLIHARHYHARVARPGIYTEAELAESEGMHGCGWSEE